MDLGANADGELLQRALDGEQVSEPGILELVAVLHAVQSVDQAGLAPRAEFVSDLRARLLADDATAVVPARAARTRPLDGDEDGPADADAVGRRRATEATAATRAAPCRCCASRPTAEVHRRRGRQHPRHRRCPRLRVPLGRPRRRALRRQAAARPGRGPAGRLAVRRGPDLPRPGAGAHRRRPRPHRPWRPVDARPRHRVRRRDGRDGAGPDDPHGGLPHRAARRRADRAGRLLHPGHPAGRRDAASGAGRLARVVAASARPARRGPGGDAEGAGRLRRVR